jgi:hypothetical protein
MMKNQSILIARAACAFFFCLTVVICDLFATVNHAAFDILFAGSFLVSFGCVAHVVFALSPNCFGYESWQSTQLAQVRHVQLR